MAYFGRIIDDRGRPIANPEEAGRPGEDGPRDASRLAYLLWQES